MKQLACVLAILIMLAVSRAPAMADSSAAEAAAEKAAAAWIDLIDAGDYAESWKQSAAYFRAAITSEQWEQQLRAVRLPLGKELSRKLKSSQYTTSLPGAPDGQYVVLKYDTSFEHKKSSVETITPMLDSDGVWHVSGYFIR